MDQILERLYLGSLEDAQVQPAPVTRILNLAQRSYLSQIPCRWYWIPDERWLPAPVWERLSAQVARWIDGEHQCVLVHCRLGVSRSPSVVVATLLRCGYFREPETALQYVHRCRELVNPHQATWASLCAWWQERTHRHRDEEWRELLRYGMREYAHIWDALAAR